MSEETKQENQGQEATENKEPNNEKQISLEEFLTLKESNEKLSKTLDKVSKNYDRLNTEYQKKQVEIKEKEDEKLSVKEYIEKQKAELAAQTATQKKELETMQLNFEKTKLINEKKLEAKLLDIVQGKSLDDFTLNLTILEDIINKIADEKVNKRLGSSNTPPKEKDKSAKSTTDEFYTMEEMKSMSREDISKNKDKFYKSYANARK